MKNKFFVVPLFSLLLISTICIPCEEVEKNIPSDQLQLLKLLGPIVYNPWREAYNKKIMESRATESKPTTSKVCPFCEIAAGRDTKNWVVLRGKYNMVILNLNPHTKGHLLVIPNEHVPRCAHLEREAQKEHALLVNKSVEILKRSQEAGGLSADGVKVGLNFGAIAGASIPDHVHTQIVPLSVRENQEFLKRLLDEEDELPWDLKTLCAELQPAFCSMSLENNIHPEDDEWCDHKEGCMHCDIVHGRIPIMNNLVLERYKYNMAILKLASRARGQLCIIPHKHVEDPNQLSHEAQEENWWLAHKSAEILEKVQHTDGVNITMNVGAVAGAKVNNHFVTEVEPRYQSELVRDGFFTRSRDLSYMRWSLPKLHAELQPSFQKLKEESSS